MYSFHTIFSSFSCLQNALLIHLLSLLVAISLLEGRDKEKQKETKGKKTD